MNKNIPTSAVLDAAADAIQMAGWTTANLTAPDGDPWGREAGAPMCLEGGIMAAAGIPESFMVAACPAYRAVWDYLDGADSWANVPDQSRLYDWNDAPGRTAEEVIEVLRAAAAVERVKEATVAGYETEDQPLPVQIPAA